jgi:long-chain acyl-CoA synthetase
LLEHESVGDAVVYPYIRDDGKEVVQAAIVARKLAVTDFELSSFCFEKMSEYKVPVFFHFVDSLPRTTSGKIRKIDLPCFPKKLILPTD